MFCPSSREGLGGKGCTVCAQVGTRRYQNPAGFGHYPQLSPGEMGWMKHRCLIALQSLSSPVQTWFQQRVVMRKVKMARTNTSWASNKMCAVRWGDLVSSAPATHPCASVHSVCGALCSTPPPCSKALPWSNTSQEAHPTQAPYGSCPVPSFSIVSNGTKPFQAAVTSSLSPLSFPSLLLHPPFHHTSPSFPPSPLNPTTSLSPRLSRAALLPLCYLWVLN